MQFVERQPRPSSARPSSRCAPLTFPDRRVQHPMDTHRRPASARPAPASPRQTFRPTSAHRHPTQPAAPRTPSQQRSASARRPHSARALRSAGVRSLASPLHFLHRQMSPRRRTRRDESSSAELPPDRRNAAMWAAVERESDIAAVRKVGKFAPQPVFPRFDEQPPSEEMAELIKGSIWVTHYAPLSNARLVKKWPRVRKGDSFIVQPGADRDAAQNVLRKAAEPEPPVRVGFRKGSSDNESDTVVSDPLEHRISHITADSAANAVVARRIARARPPPHHGCGYSIGQEVLEQQSSEPVMEVVESEDEPVIGAWFKGHRCHTSRAEDQAAARIQAIYRGKKARKRVRGIRIEQELGLTGSAEETRQIEKMQARHRGRKDRQRVKAMKGRQLEEDLGLTGSEDEARQIAKLQAAQRGKLERKKLAERKAKRIEDDLGLTGSEDEARHIARIQAAQRGKHDRQRVAELRGKRIEEELGLTGSDEEAKRIAKLQAAQRGKLERKKLAQMKAEAESQQEPESGTEGVSAPLPPGMRGGAEPTAVEKATSAEADGAPSVSFALPSRRALPPILDQAHYSFLADEIHGVHAADSASSVHSDDDSKASDKASESGGSSTGKDDDSRVDGDDAAVSQASDPATGLSVFSGYRFADLRALQAEGQLEGESICWREKDDGSLPPRTTLAALVAQHREAVLLGLRVRLRARRALSGMPRQQDEPRSYLPTAQSCAKIFEGFEKADGESTAAGEGTLPLPVFEKALHALQLGLNEEEVREVCTTLEASQQAPPSEGIETSIHVKVGRCLGTLAKTDAIGNPDPYVRLAFEGGSRARTEHVENDRTAPEWQEILELELPPEPAGLLVEVIDHDPQPGEDDDDVLASGLVDLREFVSSWSGAPAVDGAEKLRPGSGVDAGTVVATLRTVAVQMGHGSRATTTAAGQPLEVTLAPTVIRTQPADSPPPPTESAEEGEEAEPVVNWKEVLEEITRLDAEAEAFAAAHSNAK